LLIYSPEAVADPLLLERLPSQRERKKNNTDASAGRRAISDRSEPVDSCPCPKKFVQNRMANALTVERNRRRLAMRLDNKLSKLATNTLTYTMLIKEVCLY
jgi:hypothetical protein